MTIFFKGDYDPEEHAKLFDELYGKIPDDEVDLVEGIDEVILEEEPKEKESE